MDAFVEGSLYCRLQFFLTQNTNAKTSAHATDTVQRVGCFGTSFDALGLKNYHWHQQIQNFTLHLRFIKACRFSPYISIEIQRCPSCSKSRSRRRHPCVPPRCRSTEHRTKNTPPAIRARTLPNQQMHFAFCVAENSCNAAGRAALQSCNHAQPGGSGTAKRREGE